MLAAILIRGLINVDVRIRRTLEMLRLLNKNTCVVLKDNESMKGMLVKAKDYLTWGEISDETFKELVDKRGLEFKGPTEDRKGIIKYSNFIEVDGKKVKPFFRLHPPRGGFERKGIKSQYASGGALGYRADKMNNLIRKMI